MEEKITTVRAVDRALSILKCFTLEKRRIGLSELSRMVKLPKSTVYRLLNSLKIGGFIDEDRTTESYRLSMLMFRLGNVAEADAQIVDIALPFMQELANNTLETVVLNVIVGDDRVPIKVLDSPHSLRRFIKAGEALPLFLGASSRLLLAHESHERQKEIYRKALQNGQIEMPLDSFLEELEAVKRTEYTYSKDERIIGASAVSAPVFDYSGQCVAGLTVSGATARFSEKKVAQIITQLIRTAKSVSKKMGYDGSDHG